MTPNPQLDLAFEFLESTGTNLFLTGRAGTGKTTFLHEVRRRTPKRMIVVAPTGVAAIHAGGVTMHSFFQLPFGPYVPDTQRTQDGRQMEHARYSRNKIAILRSIDLLVIDEISMVRADTLDAVDAVLRRFRDRERPFGGVQLLMIGDVQQLAPVVKDEEWNLLRNHYASPFFFDSRALRQTPYLSIELQHVYRQQDEGFLALLNAVRDNTLSPDDLARLNSRCRPGFEPGEGCITLTSHNHTAREINARRLAALPGPARTFTATVEGDFPEYSFPTDPELELREGAQVMFTKNDASPEKRYYNGLIGTVTEIGDERIVVAPSDGGDPIEVEEAEWTNTKYTLDEQTREITESVEGRFIQYPLKTAWAITIHKSQGLTFEQVAIDAADAFSAGQVYVALSRCKTLEGIHLLSPLPMRAIIRDRTVEAFTRRVEENRPGAAELARHRKEYYLSLLDELFDYGPVSRTLRHLKRVLTEHLNKLYPRLIQRWEEFSPRFVGEVLEVSEKFRRQLARLGDGAGDDYARDPQLAERIAKGTEYFTGKTRELILPLLALSRVEIDNKETRKAVGEALTRANEPLAVKLAVLDRAAGGFTVSGYLQARAEAVAGESTAPKQRTPKPAAERRERPKKERAAKDTLPGLPEEATAAEDGEDILHPGLFDLLREWRREEARSQGVPAYIVLKQKALIGIANTVPSDRRALSRIAGIGPRFIERYADAVLALTAEYREENTEEA